MTTMKRRYQANASNYRRRKRTRSEINAVIEQSPATIHEEQVSDSWNSAATIPHRVSCDRLASRESVLSEVETPSINTISPPMSLVESWAGVLDTKEQLQEEFLPEGILDSIGDDRSSSPCQSEEDSFSLKLLGACGGVVLGDLPSAKHQLYFNVDLPSSKIRRAHIGRRNLLLKWLYAWTLLIGIASMGRSLGKHGFGMPTVAHRSVVAQDTVCVSGGGFSGFWYIIGRLQSIPEPLTKNYYCYSAGCLGLVASFLRIEMEDLHEMAVDIQNRWKTGEISRFDVLTTFVDNMLQYAHNRTLSDGEADHLEFLGRLNVLTTVRDGWSGLKTSVRIPTNIQSLRTMLVQSAWIPFATGNELFHQGHMDGAFHLVGHPRCESSVGLPVNLDILANVVNVNLSSVKVHKFWKLGRESGW